MRFNLKRASKRLGAWLRARFLLVIGVCDSVRYSANIISLPPPMLKPTPKIASNAMTGRRFKPVRIIDSKVILVIWRMFLRLFIVP